jgi:DNA polymerase III subunit delta'
MRKAIEMDQAESLPEADRLGEFPHPRHTMQLFGQSQAEQAFLEAFASRRLHHAWLLAGRQGIGKATFAYRCARFLLASNEERLSPETSLDIEPGCVTDRQVGLLAHPRLLVIRRPYDTKAKKFTSSIPIDAVRQLRPFVSKTAEQDAWRVVIVDHVNELNIAAANALLKTLEEPPRQTVLLLISPEPGRLLATIRSRCRQLMLCPLGLPDLSKAVGAAHRGVTRPVSSEPQDQKPISEHLAQMSDGSVRRALALADGDGEDLERRLNALFSNLPNVDWRQVQLMADKVSKIGEEQNFHLLFELFLRRITGLVHASIEGPSSDIERELAARLVAPGMLARWAQLWERVAREKAQADSLNLDRKALIVRMVSELAETAGGFQPSGR